MKSLKTSSLGSVVASCRRWQSTRCLTLKCQDCEDHDDVDGNDGDVDEVNGGGDDDDDDKDDGDGDGIDDADDDLHLHHPAKSGFLRPPHEEEDGEILDEHHLRIIIIIN